MSRNASAYRIRKLSVFHEPGRIASMLKISKDEVMDVLEGPSEERVAVTLWCNRSSRVWHVRSWRAAYMRVCLHGLTDWGWCQTAVYQAWAEARSGAA